jgi:hypothetical protein
MLGALLHDWSALLLVNSILLSISCKTFPKMITILLDNCTTPSTWSNREQEHNEWKARRRKSPHLHPTLTLTLTLTLTPNPTSEPNLALSPTDLIYKKNFESPFLFPPHLPRSKNRNQSFQTESECSRSLQHTKALGESPRTPATPHRVLQDLPRGAAIKAIFAANSPSQLSFPLLCFTVKSVGGNWGGWRRFIRQCG